MEPIVPLDTLSSGELGRICDLCGNQELVARLEEMGLRVGTELRMVQPGRPCIIAVANQRLSLRADENILILVEVCRESSTLPISA